MAFMGRSVFFDHLISNPRALLLDDQLVYKKPTKMKKGLGNHVASVWYLTMDSADCLERAVLPLMNIGDWIF